MSAFLAPIHYNMFGKIKKQDEINKDLIKEFGDDDLLNRINAEVGSVPEGELENIIDHGNIHGWLQGQIDVVESAFSNIVRSLQSKGISMEELVSWFENRGKNELSAATGEEVFRTFTNSFLDGMPCDRAIMPLEFTDSGAKWVQNADVHGKYWDDEGNTYNELRCAWIKGLAENSGYDFNYNEGTYEVSK